MLGRLAGFGHFRAAFGKIEGVVERRGEMAPKDFFFFSPSAERERSPSSHPLISPNSRGGGLFHAWGKEGKREEKKSGVSKKQKDTAAPRNR